MLRALQDGGLAGSVRFIGFDSSPKLVEGLRAGHIQALVVQNPLRMGYLGVKTMVAHLRGKTVDRRVDTGVTLITRTMMDDPDIRSLLQPDLTEWLQ
jgi:ribose transport system substrate-binding protein